MTLAPSPAASRTNPSALVRLSSSTSEQLICTMARRRSVDSGCVASSGTEHLSQWLLLRHAVERSTARDEVLCAQTDDLAAGEQWAKDGQSGLVVGIGVLRDHRSEERRGGKGGGWRSGPDEGRAQQVGGTER